ncbi:MAG: cation:proton antiporter subunit C [Natrialbaceae archaeon]|nr:cation:proton antiporter subunit C [Natrialbaceae archaeon]
MIELYAARYTYVLVVLLIAVGLYMLIANENLVKKIIGLGVFQSAIFLFFVSTAYVEGGSSPVIEPGVEQVLVSPLPQVIVLTAIVVGVSLTALGLALVVRLFAEYGTLREDSIQEVRTDE